MTLLRMDELNRLTNQTILKLQSMDGKRLKETDIEDEILDLLEMSYIYGAEDVLSTFSASQSEEISPTDIFTAEGNKLAEIVDYSLVEKSVEKSIAGKTAKERIDEYMESGDVEAIVKVVETETHRIYNAGSYETADRLGATSKTWVTMKDNRVRDTHDYLEGMTVPIDAEFYTYNGNHTYYPGQFGIAEEDINCRCTLVFGKE